MKSLDHKIGIAVNKIAGLSIFVKILNIFNHSYGPLWRKKKAVIFSSKDLNYAARH